MRPWRIKVCGVTSAEDASVVAAAGADAIGVNFCRQSPRYVDAQAAAAILAAVPQGLQKVGVFVNAAADEILSCCDQLRLDLIQLHGDEPPELMAQLSGRPVVRAFRCGAEGLTPAVDYLRRCRALDAAPQFVLLDALHPGQYGGTGRTLDWARLSAEIARLGGLPWVLSRRPESGERGSGHSSAPPVRSGHGQRRRVGSGPQRPAAGGRIRPCGAGRLGRTGGSARLTVVVCHGSATCVDGPRVYHKSVGFWGRAATALLRVVLCDVMFCVVFYVCWLL